MMEERIVKENIANVSNNVVNEITQNNREIKTLALLDELEELVDTSTKVPLTSKVLINPDDLYCMIHEIRNALPMEIIDAEKITNAVKDIMQNAENKSEKIMRDADMYADEKLNDSRIISEAKKIADEIMKEATDYEIQMREKMELYVKEILTAAEQGISCVLSDALGYIQEAKEISIGGNV